jgi:hypothetical protein
MIVDKVPAHVREQDGKPVHKSQTMPDKVVNSDPTRVKSGHCR